MNIKTKILEAILKGYYVDSEGNVYSKTRKLKLVTNSGGYYNFSIRIGKIRTTIPVHQFVGFFKYGSEMLEHNYEVRHLNGNRLDNSWENLLIGNHSENMLDIPKEERIIKSIAAKKNSRRFDDNEVQEIINDRNSGMKYSQLCEKYNTSKSTLSYLFNNAYYTGARKVENEAI